jgi:hypothetical protein
LCSRRRDGNNAWVQVGPTVKEYILNRFSAAEIDTLLRLGVKTPDEDLMEKVAARHTQHIS